MVNAPENPSLNARMVVPSQLIHRVRAGVGVAGDEETHDVVLSGCRHDVLRQGQRNIGSELGGEVAELTTDSNELHRDARIACGPAGQIAGLKASVHDDVPGPHLSVIAPIVSAAVITGASFAPVTLKVSVAASLRAEACRSP